MSKKITFKGLLVIGEEQRIKLATINGKTGYRITKLQTIAKNAGASDSVSLVTIYKTKGLLAGVTNTDLSNSNILATAYKKMQNGSAEPDSETIISDLEIFNQDIFITAGSPDGDTQPVSYYLELEAMDISDIQATKLTLENIRTITFDNV
jgi:hypothetical protein